MHFMPNNNLEKNISHFILNAQTKKNLPPKIAFQILGTQKLHLGNQVPGSRKFSCPAKYYSNIDLDIDDSGYYQSQYRIDLKFYS